MPLLKEKKNVNFYVSFIKTLLSGTSFFEIFSILTTSFPHHHYGILYHYSQYLNHNGRDDDNDDNTNEGVSDRSIYHDIWRGKILAR